LPQSAHAGATNLTANQGCGGGLVSVLFAWSGNDPSALQQSLDLSAADNGWEPNTFASAAPLPPTATSFQWDGLQPGTTYYARVTQTLASGALDGSATYQVQTIGCDAATAAAAPSQADIDRAACSAGDFAACTRYFASILAPGQAPGAFDCASAGPLGVLFGCPQ
jgi:hypothetical protein